MCATRTACESRFEAYCAAGDSVLEKTTSAMTEGQHLGRYGFVLPVLLLLAGCNRHTSFSGTVVGRDGQPIVNARVTLLLSETDPARRSEALTDEFGQFSIGMTHPTYDVSFFITIEKDGYEPFIKKLSTTEHITLSRKIILDLVPRRDANQLEHN